MWRPTPAGQSVSRAYTCRAGRDLAHGFVRTIAPRTHRRTRALPRSLLADTASRSVRQSRHSEDHLLRELYRGLFPPGDALAVLVRAVDFPDPSRAALPSSLTT